MPATDNLYPRVTFSIIAGWWGQQPGWRAVCGVSTAQDLSGYAKI